MTLQYNIYRVSFFLLILLSVAASMTANSPIKATIPTLSNGDMRFGRFHIPANHIFLRTAKSAAFVNLRPIVPGHVLVMPETIVPTMAELSTEEYTDLWLAVRQVQAALATEFQVDAFNVAVQDGRAAGQSVPHVHVHILPRKSGDFERNDDVYEELDAWVPKEGILKEKGTIDVPDDEDREDRTLETMAAEAAIYKRILGGLDHDAKL